MFWDLFNNSNRLKLNDNKIYTQGYMEEWILSQATFNLHTFLLKELFLY